MGSPDPGPFAERPRRSNDPAASFSARPAVKCLSVGKVPVRLTASGKAVPAEHFPR